MAISIRNVPIIDSSDDLQIYLNEKSFRVFAGPGAGKTHLLVENIKKIIENSDKLKKDGRKILCITYTNAAADEVKKRLGFYSQYVYVATIHSFLYDCVIKNNQKQVKYMIKDKYDIEISRQVKLSPRIEGMNLLATTKKSDLHEYLIRKGMDQIKVESLSKTKIGKCIMNINAINVYPFNCDIMVNIDDAGIFAEKEIKIVKSAIFEIAQEIDFDEILYLGYLLIKEYNHIRYLLKYKFPFIFVDEYQDTNPLQNATLKLFADDQNVVWGVIGDLVQSIYSFQGSTYQEFENFETSKEHLDYRIENNRRSTANIINFCSFFRQKDLIIPKQECVKNLSTNEKVKIVVHSGEEEPNSLFNIDDETFILCRGSAEVFLFTNIESNQKKILKKIADTYQYQMGIDMLNLIDQGREDWLKLSKFIVELKESINKNSLSKIMSAVKGIIDTTKITTKSNEQGNYYKKLMEFIEKINGIDDATTLDCIVKNINSWLCDTGMMIREDFNIPINGEEYFIENIHSNVKMLNVDTIKKMINQVYSNNSKFMTIHKSKGLEFNKVIVGIEPFAKEEKYIDKLDILKNPRVFIEGATLNSVEEEIAEYTRILYVGFSRAINELSIYVKIKAEEKELFINSLESSLNEYATSNNIEEKFYEIKNI